ncbi:MAG: hypothetical protein ABS79_07645 [Planctomycetes bacterium SCN 63-9]|nr:MAG: hypothetical protein ABS79_07645 [Planctomycetes bacterium SCN 63-9]
MDGIRRKGNPLAIAALAALIATGCGQPGGEANEEGRAAATQFLDELRAGRLEVAWQGTSSEFKSLMGLENLRDYVKRHPGLKATAEYADSRPVERNGQAMNEYVFHATARAVRGKMPKPSTIKVLAGAGGEGWRVEQLVVE